MPSRGVTLLVAAVCGVVGVAQLTAGKLVGGVFILACCITLLVSEVLGVGRKRD